MIRSTSKSTTDAGAREAMRRELLRMIVKNEAQRRDQRKSVGK